MRIVVVLLLALAAVLLLLGPGTARLVLGSIFAVLAIVGAGALAIEGVLKLAALVKAERDRDNAGLAAIPLAIGLVLSVVSLLAGSDTLKLWAGSCFLVAFVVAIIETAHNWLPKLPGRVAYIGKLAAAVFVGPVVAPYRRLVEIRQRRAQGEAITTGQATGQVAAVLAVSVALWLFEAIAGGMIVAIVTLALH